MNINIISANKLIDKNTGAVTWLRRTIGWCAVVGGICFSASAEDQLNREAPNNRNVDKPHSNPSPKDVLILKGHKDPKLEILFSAAYSTTNPECESRSVPGAIFGAPKVPQTIYDAVRVAPGKSAFSVSFYLDRYLPGRCNWQPISILHLVKDPDLSGHQGHHGLVVIRQDGKRQTILSFACRKLALHADDDKATVIACRRKRTSLDETAISHAGGEVDLEYTSAPEEHY